jgi:glycosyltransferase involved in cell wall biosynthesis
MGALRRLARALGLGRLLRRLGLLPLLRRLLGREAPDDPAARALPGVLLVGHPYGVLGVGEYLRSTAAALEAAGVPFHVRNAFDFGQELRPKHGGALWDRLTTGRPHRVNVFQMNADEMADARRHLGRAFFADRYNVACWHWELGNFPAAWRGALDGLHELWASSRFIQATLSAGTSLPVTWMPHPVDVSGVSPLPRSALGLPEHAFLFVTGFDFTSFIARKNPRGALRAFQSAFPAARGEAVGLVVKVNGAALRPEDARAFRAWPELADPRVTVVDEVLDRGSLLGLFARCDCFVSLHRAEGFGRGIAEAMLLGRPVIVTGYSGNVDFTDADTACVVGHRLVDVKPGEYPHAEGQQWAEPDLEQAAAHMRRVFADRAWAAALAERGRARVEAQHGLAAAGAHARARLQELGFL